MRSLPIWRRREAVLSEIDGKERDYRIGNAPFRARPLEPALYIVATPIGNLGDMTIRGIETLAAADIVACEDTRVSRVLLDRYGISRRPHAYHEHNAATAGPKLIEALLAGKSVALVSDAGTPLVSDPGGRLVPEAKAAGIRVVPIPGASAVLAALTASGLLKDSFHFAGFLSSRQGQRRAKLEQLKSLDAALVFFESPNRAATTLADMVE
ncbi:MAG: 16S rRNA (cytidine(1402)-2'-O)-methyltransferase, partial [Phyllobacterium sp.]